MLASLPVPVIHPVSLASHFHPGTLPNASPYYHAAPLSTAYHDPATLAIWYNDIPRDAICKHTTLPLPAYNARHAVTHEHVVLLRSTGSNCNHKCIAYYAPPLGPLTITTRINPMDLDSNLITVDMAVPVELKRTGAISNELYLHLASF